MRLIYVLDWIVTTKAKCCAEGLDLTLQGALELAADPDKCDYHAAVATLGATAEARIKRLGDKFKAKFGINCTAATADNMASFIVPAMSESALVAVTTLKQATGCFWRIHQTQPFCSSTRVLMTA